MLGMVRGLVVGLVDSGSLLHWDRARMLAKKNKLIVVSSRRSAESGAGKKNSLD